MALVCATGAGISGNILYVHRQIDTLGDAYTSFCSVNDSINCDRVLSSSYAKLAGVPVAWFALATYAGMALLFAAAARSGDDRSRSKMLGLGSVGIVGALAFSGYMAVIAGYRLETLCLLCMSLYAVSLTNAGLAFAAARTVRGAGEPYPLPPAVAGAIFLVCVAALTALAYFTWPRTTAPLSAAIRTADDVRSSDPEFHQWFTGLPRTDVASLVREDQARDLPKDKVVVVDFFDLECGHCRKNFLMTKELKANRGDQVMLVHRHFPLDAACNDIVPQTIHPNACRAAEAVECAGLQGKHDEMIEILFANQGQLFAENLTRLAGKIGLDKDAMQRCLDQHTTLPAVLADARAGARLNITSTPTVFVGGRRVSGVLDSVGKYEMSVLLEMPATR
jgi:uncharacterized membrane protein/thiol-disulfide isomerase/thioredoxin